MKPPFMSFPRKAPTSKQPAPPPAPKREAPGAPNKGPMKQCPNCAYRGSEAYCPECQTRMEPMKAKAGSAPPFAKKKAPPFGKKARRPESEDGY